MSRFISGSKLNRFWNNGILPIKDKVDNPISTYSDLMANTVEGYSVDPLAVKEGFTEVNSRFDDNFNYDNYIANDISVPINTTWTDVISYVPRDGNGNYLVIVQILVPASLDENTMVTVATNSGVGQSNTATILAKASARRVQAVGVVNVSDTSPTIRVQAHASPVFTCTDARIICIKLK